MRLDVERAAVATLVERLAIDCPSIEAPLGQLSGGNQQKVALARALLAEPRVLLLDEPTRGIDVGAKRDVYALVRGEAARGVAILLVSSEIDELVALCHRVLVVRRGRLVAELERPALSRERLLRAALGHEEAA
jgi:ABC-type sugar transport system ATPase subunit